MLLIYPDKGITTYNNPENQVYLTKRIKTWFDRCFNEDVKEAGIVKGKGTGYLIIDPDRKRQG